MYGKSKMKPTLPRVKQTASRNLLYVSKPKQRLRINQEGWDGEGGSKWRGYMYTYV